MMYKHVPRVMFMKKLFIKFLKNYELNIKAKKSWFCVIFLRKREKKRIARVIQRATKIERRKLKESYRRKYFSLSCYVAANQVLTAKLLPNDENDSRLMSQTHSRRSHNSRKHCNHYFLRAQRLSSIQVKQRFGELVMMLKILLHTPRVCYYCCYLNFLFDLHRINFTF